MYNMYMCGGTTNVFTKWHGAYQVPTYCLNQGIVFAVC